MAEGGEGGLTATGIDFSNPKSNPIWYTVTVLQLENFRRQK